MDKNKAGLILEGLKDVDNIGSLMDYLHEKYGDKQRKGIGKLELTHAYDTFNNTHVEDIDDVTRSVDIFKASVLHDMLEDTGDSLEEISRRVGGLSDRQKELLKLLSRNVDNEGGVGYLEAIMKDEDATIIKFADRSSNIKDLILWIEDQEGFCKDSKRITEKYIDETDKMIAIFKKHYKVVKEPLKKDYAQLKSRFENLKKVYNEYKDKPLQEAVYKDEKEFSVKPIDLARTVEIIEELYDKHESLQKDYPTFKKRIDKFAKKIDDIVEKQGYAGLKKMFDSVKFDEKDFKKSYENYIDRVFLDGLKKIGSLRTETPKDGIKRFLMRDLKMTMADLQKIITSEEDDKLQKVYKAITGLMGNHFKDISKDLNKMAKRFKGYTISRPGKFKKPERAVEKYLEDQAEKKKKGENLGDFLDLGDILGFRSLFKKIGKCIDFSVAVIEERGNTLYKIKSFIGEGSPYQGVNIQVNYEGTFNYELQAVVDTMQLATDISHDIIYKKKIEVTQEEKKAVMMLTQIGMGMMFGDLFREKYR